VGVGTAAEKEAAKEAVSHSPAQALRRHCRRHNL
jgi:hypothetical protein